MSYKLLEKSHFQSVPASSVSNSDYIIPNGSILLIEKIGADCPQSGSNHGNFVKIIWDPSGINQILFSTSSPNFVLRESEFIGDGVKILRISLSNRSLIALNMGGYYIGKQL